ncbi:hypothetical protein B7463_g10773, partial [Scytalidium lignicola]
MYNFLPLLKAYKKLDSKALYYVIRVNLNLIYDRMPFKTYTYKTFGASQSVLADVHYNDNAKANRQAVALTIHAGGFVMGKRDNIAPHWIKELTNRDFIVVTIDYRLCPQVSVYDGPIRDTQDAYHWCRDRLPAILIWGHLSMMLGLEEEKPCAILNGYGPLFLRDPSYRKPAKNIMPMIPEGSLDFDEDLMNKVYDEPVLTYYNPVVTNASGKLEIDFSKPRNAWHFGHLSHGTWIKAVGIEGYEDLVDPALHLDKDFPPTFFLWGEKDELVDVRLAHDAYKKLSRCGVDTELTVADGMGHAFGSSFVEGTEEYEKFVVKPVEFLKKYADKA